MRYLKYPQEKRRDRSIPFVQDSFTTLMKDIPASECPNNAVVDAVNALLFGDRWKARPGSTKWSDTVLPGSTALTNITSDSNKRASDYTFTTADIGSYIVYTNGEIEEITDNFGSYAVIQGGSSTVPASTGVIQRPINGIGWHKKTQKIFVHIGTNIYFTDYSVTTWTQLYFSIGALTNSRSSFDSFNDYIYVFNDNGVFKIDTQESPYYVIQINTASPPNTINPCVSGSPLNITDYDEDTVLNNVGRRYIYSLAVLDGTGEIRNRFDDKLIKETGTNPATSANDYKDYKEIWFKNTPGDAIQANSTFRYKIPTGLNTWIGKKLSWNLTITDVAGNSTTALVVGDYENVSSWDDVARQTTIALRKTFETYPHLRCTYTSFVNILCIISGETDVNIGAISTPSSIVGEDGTITHWAGTSTLSPVGYNIIGRIRASNPDIPLRIPSGEYGWTHFSVYSTKTFTSDFNDLTNKQLFVWNADIRVVAIIKGTISSLGVLTVTEGELENCDSGCVAHMGDGSSLTIEDVISSTSANTSIIGDGSTVLTITIGASSFMEAVVVSNTLTIPVKLSGTRAGTHVANTLVDTGATFVTDGIVAGDWVKNTITGATAQVTKILRGTNNYGGINSVLDYSKDFVTAGIQNTYIVKDLIAGTTTTVINVAATELTLAAGIISGSERYIVYEPNSETQLQLDADIFDSDLDTYEIYRGKLLSTDVGKTVHWRDGTTGIITALTDDWTATVNTPDDKAQMPMAIDLIGRHFSDVIKDDVLSNRQEDWLPLGRFMTALPSGELGDVSPGFLNVAARLDQKSYYSSINLDNIYMAGHYRADYQFLEFKDRLIEIQEMPNQTIFWCTSSTFKTQTNVQNGAEDGLSGEYIPIQSGPALTDGSIGAMDKNSIIDIGIGQKMVITSEPGIRMFDGYRYGENQVIDEKGRGLILKDLQLLRHRFIATYDPNLYGFIFWGNNTTIVFNSTAELVRSTKCFRLAIRPEQGFSFSELSGDDWLWPFLGGGPLLINDNAEEQFLIIFDHKSRKPYVLSTRKYSALSTRTVSFLDKETTEIAGSIKHIEHTAQEEDKKLRFMEQYFYMRPDDEANKGAGGHDSYGFRTAQEIRIDCFLDGNVTADAEVNQNSNKSVQIYGVNQTKNLLPNLAYPYKVEARRVQHKISFTASEIECVKYRVLYDEKNVIVPPQLVTGERNWQREFALPVFWISRGTDKLLNLVTGKSGNSSTGSYNTRTGPDGKANSSMDLDGQTFTWNNIVTAPDTTFLFHIENRSDLSFDYKEVATGELYDNRIRIFTEISGIDKLLKVYIEDVEIAALAINTILGIDLYIVIDVRAASVNWGSKYPLANPRIEFADNVWIGGSKVAVRLRATATSFEQFPGVSIKPTWTSAPWYIWKFQSIPSTQYPPPNSRFGFTDNASYDGNVYDFHHGETGNRVFLQILSDITGTNAQLKLKSVRTGVLDSDASNLVVYSDYVTYPIADFKTKSFKLELSGNQARMLYDGSPVVTLQTDGSGWVTYTTTGADFRPTAPLSSQTFWAQLDDNYDLLTSELIISDVPFNAGVQSYTPIGGDIIIKVYDQYETLFGTATGVISISGSKTVTLQITGTSTALFDFRKYNQDANNLISDAAKLYWIRDINQYAGFSLLPEVGS